MEFTYVVVRLEHEDGKQKKETEARIIDPDSVPPRINVGTLNAYLIAEAVCDEIGMPNHEPTLLKFVKNWFEDHFYVRGWNVYLPKWI